MPLQHICLRIMLRLNSEMVTRIEPELTFGSAESYSSKMQNRAVDHSRKREMKMNAKSLESVLRSWICMPLQGRNGYFKRPSIRAMANDSSVRLGRHTNPIQSMGILGGAAGPLIAERAPDVPQPQQHAAAGRWVRGAGGECCNRYNQQSPPALMFPFFDRCTLTNTPRRRCWCRVW